MAAVRTRPTLGAEAWALLFQVFKAQKPYMARVTEEFDLSPVQGHALYLLEQPRSMSELATILCCDASNVTGLVDRLETRGLIERRPAEHDRRVKMLVLTDEGRDVRARAVALFFEAPPAIEALTRNEQRQLRDLLQKVLAATR